MLETQIRQPVSSDSRCTRESLGDLQVVDRLFSCCVMLCRRFRHIESRKLFWHHSLTYCIMSSRGLQVRPHVPKPAEWIQTKARADLRLASYSGRWCRRMTRGPRSPCPDLGCRFAHSALAFYLPEISRAVPVLFFIPSRTYQASARPLYFFVFINCTSLRSLGRALNDVFYTSTWVRTRWHTPTTQGTYSMHVLPFAQAEMLRRKTHLLELPALRRSLRIRCRSRQKWATQGLAQSQEGRPTVERRRRGSNGLEQSDRVAAVDSDVSTDSRHSLVVHRNRSTFKPVHSAAATTFIYLVLRTADRVRSTAATYAAAERRVYVLGTGWVQRAK